MQAKVTSTLILCLSTLLGACSSFNQKPLGCEARFTQASSPANTHLQALTHRFEATALAKAQGPGFGLKQFNQAN